MITKEAKELRNLLNRKFREVAVEQDKSVVSIPPPGYCPVSNLYVDPETGKLVVIYDDVPR